MKRLRAAIYWDIQLQFRNGFYYASAAVVILWLVLFSQLSAADLGLLLPPFILTNLTINTFYFVAGLVLLEKGEGTLEMQVVTPLRTEEYLISKVSTLALLSLIENLLLIALIYGLGFNFLLLSGGLILASIFYTLVGFIAVARYDSINEYLMPSILYMVFFSLPLFPYFDLWDHWLIYLHPLQAPLVMMQAAFQPVPLWQLVYSLLYAGLWIWLVYRICRQVFQRFIISKEGIRP